MFSKVFWIFCKVVCTFKAMATMMIAPTKNIVTDIKVSSMIFTSFKTWDNTNLESNLAGLLSITNWH